jgi:hypothetical protein
MCMHSASEGLKIDNVELHEFAYTFFANLAKVMKLKMAPYLPVLVPHLLAEVRELALFRRESCCSVFENCSSDFDRCVTWRYCFAS